jgi:clan AA aspartic protease (TIGR02281 family)
MFISKVILNTKLKVSFYSTFVMKKLIFVVICCMTFGYSLSADGQKSKEPDTYNYKRGVEAFNNNNSQEALDYFNKEISDNPHDGYAFFYVSVLRFGNNDFGAALTAVNSALKYLPSKDKEWIAAAYENRGDVYASLEDTLKAISDYSAAIKTTPEDVDMYNKRGQIYYERCDYAKSDADYNKIISLEPGNGIGYLGVARNLNAQKKYSEALDKLNNAIKLNNNNGQSFSFRASAYLGLKKYNEAADDIISSLSIDDGNYGFPLLSSSGKEIMPLLIEKLKVKATLDPQHSDMWQYYAGVVYHSNEDYREAITWYKKAFDKSSSVVAADAISSCYNELGDYQNALEYINRAVELDSTNYNYIYKKADIELESGLIDKSIASCTKFIQMLPGSYSYYLRGWAKERKGDIDGALEDYTTSVALAPYAYSYFCRGRIMQKRGDSDAAMKDYNQVLLIDTVPDNGSCRQYAYFYLGQKEKAKEWMYKMLAKGNDKGNNYDAACLYSIMGEKDSALVYLRKSFDKGYREFEHISRDNDFDGIRNLPEFKALINEYKAKTKVEVDVDNEDKGNYINKVAEIPFTNDGSSYKVKCKINGLPLYFIFDTGACDISLSNVEASFMLKNDYIKPQDIQGKQNYSTASGEIVEGTVINLRNVALGNLSLKDVQASVINNQDAPLLLGQTVMNRLGRIEIDNEKKVLRITYKEKVTKAAADAGH